MKKLMLLVVAAIMAATFITTAEAVVFTLQPADLLSFTQIGGVGTLIGVTPAPGGATFEGSFSSSLTQWREMQIGDATAPVANLSSYSHYALDILNTDNNDTSWVNLWMVTNGTYYENGWIELIPGAGSWIMWDISGIANLNDVEQIGFGVATNESTPTYEGSPYFQGDQFNLYVKTAIPEPTSMLLLGIGILGLFGLGRKKA